MCVSNTYCIGVQYELNNVARVVGQSSDGGARNQLAVVLRDGGKKQNGSLNSSFIGLNRILFLFNASIIFSFSVN